MYRTKRLVIGLLGFTLLFAMLANAVTAAEKPQPMILLEGELLDFGSEPPYIENGVTMVPARMYLQKLGFTVDWENETNTIVAESDSVSIRLQIGNDTATVNGENILLPSAPKLVGSKSFIPLRFVTELTENHVLWDQAFNAVVVKLGSKGLFWKVEREGNTVYLLGSIHVGSADMYPLRKLIYEAFRSSDALVVEADISSLTEDMQAEIGKLSQNPEGKTLTDVISEETYALLTEKVKPYGVDPAVFEPYQPWSVANTLQLLKGMESGFAAELGVDQIFLSGAAQLGKPVIELESIEQQLLLYRSLSEDEQEQLLKDTLDDFEQIPDDIRELAAIWVTGDADQLQEKLAADMEGSDIENAFLHERNDAMTAKIVEMLQGAEPATYFVVVGSAHMVGDSGIVKQLSDAGYDVIRQ